MPNEVITVDGISIKLFTEDYRNDYISLTDIARYKSDDPNSVIQNWMRSRDTIDFLGTWEILHNPDFKPLDFEGFRNSAQKGNIRDSATIIQLLVLANMESYNATLIKEGKTQKERLILLRSAVNQQIKSFQGINPSRLLAMGDRNGEEDA